MNLQEYIDSKKAKKVPADIVERWQTRIIARGLEKMGEDGARSYLRDYGRGIAGPKCLALAQQAVNMGFPALAKGFYMKAAELEGIPVSDNGNISAPVTPSIAVVDRIHVADFPDEFQPGALAPMQPVDAIHPRKHYIESHEYWSQPKIDGNKLIVFATANKVYYQSRQMKLNGAPDAEMDRRLKETAEKYGPFILEGELTYLDCQGKEHRTGAQAATVNTDLGHPETQPDQLYFVFACLYHGAVDLGSQSDRVLEGFRLASILMSETHRISSIATAVTAEEKLRLTANQVADGREGEVWFKHNIPYRAGKHDDDSYVRTKYLTEFEAIVTDLTATTAQGFAFGAAVISDLQGKPLGSVGTGFSLSDRDEIKRRHLAAPGQLKIRVCSQGYTENRAAWHARWQGFAE